jgi:hypothetical protein
MQAGWQRCWPVHDSEVVQQLTVAGQHNT